MLFQQIGATGRAYTTSWSRARDEDIFLGSLRAHGEAEDLHHGFLRGTIYVEMAHTKETTCSASRPQKQACVQGKDCIFRQRVMAIYRARDEADGPAFGVYFEHIPLSSEASYLLAGPGHVLAWALARSLLLPRFFLVALISDLRGLQAGQARRGCRRRNAFAHHDSSRKVHIIACPTVPLLLDGGDDTQ